MTPRRGLSRKAERRAGVAMGVVLIGYRGCGKTTVGRLLAERCGAEFIDTDELIVQSAGRSVAEIFATEGEVGFRSREQQAIEVGTERPGRILSVGGGAVESERNGRRLRDYGTVVWLTAPAETLWARVHADPSTARSRPDLAEGGIEEVRRILARRIPQYEAIADFIVEVSEATPLEIASEIQGRLRNRPSEQRPPAP